MANLVNKTKGGPVTYPGARVILEDLGKAYLMYEEMAVCLGHPEAVRNTRSNAICERQIGIVLNSHLHLDRPQEDGHICCVQVDKTGEKILIGEKGLKPLEGMVQYEPGQNMET